MREILRMVGFDSRKCVSIMGAVVGYGFALQAYCLEGFDFLGLHQTMYLWCNGSTAVSKTVSRGSSPWRYAKYVAVAERPNEVDCKSAKPSVRLRLATPVYIAALANVVIAPV